MREETMPIPTGKGVIGLWKIIALNVAEELK